MRWGIELPWPAGAWVVPGSLLKSRRDPVPDIQVIPHTHWDREWYRPYEDFRARLIAVFDEILETLDTDPAWRFVMDGQVVALEDYLEIRPEARESLTAKVRRGQLTLGPLYVLPDEWLQHQEAAVQNLVQGTRRGRALGGVSSVGYLPDMFGHVAQMPQILAAAGIRVGVLWRGAAPPETGLFEWVAPDGSKVLVHYLPNGYGSLEHPSSDPETWMGQIQEILSKRGAFRGPGPDVVPSGTDHFPLQTNLLATIRAWDQAHPEGPRVRLATWDEYFESLTPSDRQGRPEVHGELRTPRRAHILPGTLTARHWVKAAHSKSLRYLVGGLDPLLALARWAGELPADRTQTERWLRLRDRAWGLTLANLAHDSICGCSVDETHEEVIQRAKKSSQLSQALGLQVLEALGSSAGSSLNAESTWTRAVLVPFPGPAPLLRTSLELPLGAPAPSLRAGSRLLATAEAARIEGSVESRKFSTRDEVKAFVYRHRWGQMGTFMVDRIDCSQEPVLRYTLTRRIRLVPDLDPVHAHVASLADEGDFRIEIHRPDEVELWVDAADPGGVSITSLVPAPEAPSAGAGTLERPEDSRELRLFDGALRFDPEQFRFDWDRGSESFPDWIRLRDRGDNGDEYSHSPLDDAERPPVEVQSYQKRRFGELGESLEIAATAWLRSKLTPDRLTREAERVACPFQLELRFEAPSQTLVFDLAFENRAEDHHLALEFGLPFAAPDFYAGQPFDELLRPVSLPPRHPEDTEAPMPYFPFQRWVRVESSRESLQWMAPDLFEVGVRTEEGSTFLGLTLIRGTSWLSRDDFPSRDGHAGPPLPTPGAQELGLHRYRLGFRIGDLGDPEAASRAQAFCMPPKELRIDAAQAGSLELRLELATTPALSSLAPDPESDAVLLRAYNPRDQASEFRLRPASGWSLPRAADLFGVPLEGEAGKGKASSPLGARRFQTWTIRPEEGPCSEG